MVRYDELVEEITTKASKEEFEKLTFMNNKN